MKSSLVILRIVYSLGLLGVLVFLPGFFVVIGAIVGMFIFPKYIEGIVVLVLLDGLYGFADSTPQIGVYTVVSIFSFMIIGYLKKHLTWYS